MYLLVPCWRAVLFLEFSCGHAVVFVKILLMTGLLNKMRCSVMVLLERCPPAVSPQCGQREEHDSNAVAAAGVSGAHQVASFAGGEGGAADCAYGVLSGALPLRADHGVSPAAAGVSGLAREHSALQVAFSDRGCAAERALLGGAGASRLRRQARIRCFDFGGLSDFVSSSRLGHLFHSPSLVDARVLSHEFIF